MGSGHDGQKSRKEGLMTLDRGTVPGFIQRTRKNLQLIEAQHQDKSEGHVVTQLVNSLLGIMVLPHEQSGSSNVMDMTMDSFGVKGWPQEVLLLGRADTVREFVKHMRNAVAHGLFSFSSNSRVLGKVDITFSDRPHPKAPINWQVRFNAKQLHQFCDRFMDALENDAGS